MENACISSKEKVFLKKVQERNNFISNKLYKLNNNEMIISPYLALRNKCLVRIVLQGNKQSFK